MKLGINTYTFMWSIGFKGPNPAYPDKEARPTRPMTAMALLEKARELGVKLVQTGPNLPVEKLPEAEFASFIQAAKDWGIELELGTRGLDYEHLVRMVAIAKRMGATLIRTLPEIGGKYATEGRLIPPVVRQILPVLEGEGVKLGIENGRTPGAELSSGYGQLFGCPGRVERSHLPSRAAYHVCTLQRFHHQTRLAYDGVHLRRYACR
jgi:sugar phosphate isomerase/epimerase